MSTALPPTASLLLGAQEILARVKSLASEIDRRYQGSDFVVLGVLKGAVHFVSDLLRGMTLDPRIEWVRVETYANGDCAGQTPKVVFAGDIDLHGKDLLVVDDILDRGYTYRALYRELLARGPRSLRWAFLLAKEGAADRTGLNPDFLGFKIPEVWVVGYGLDYSERYRNLEGIYSL